ncbi:hypothetical protein J6590_072396 [Homalodisca vitripennis]|nr:hypothetical protein J6590_072396 [Homalodisca vitripennis]
MCDRQHWHTLREDKSRLIETRSLSEIENSTIKVIHQARGPEGWSTRRIRLRSRTSYTNLDYDDVYYANYLVFSLTSVPVMKGIIENVMVNLPEAQRRRSLSHCWNERDGHRVDSS